MKKTSEYAVIITNRQNLYQFLGHIYRVEVEQNLLNQMNDMSFPEECSEDELTTGYQMLEKYIQHCGLEPLTELAVDYARVFLGAGIAGIEAAYPYESVYTSTRRLIMQEAWEQVAAAYRTKGLTKLKELAVPEDHIALELEFMAYLCQETQQALAKDDWAAITSSIEEQLDFLTKHLLNWVPAFCADIEKYAGTDFYKAIAKVTNGYLRLEYSFLTGMFAKTAAEA